MADLSNHLRAMAVREISDADGADAPVRAALNALFEASPMTRRVLAGSLIKRLPTIGLRELCAQAIVPHGDPVVTEVFLAHDVRPARPGEPPQLIVDDFVVSQPGTNPKQVMVVLVRHRLYPSTDAAVQVMHSDQAELLTQTLPMRQLQALRSRL